MLASKVLSVDALDFSEVMIAYLKEKNIFNILATQGDGQNLLHNDETFDLAYSLFGLMFFSDRIKGFTEIHKMLKKDGVAIVSSWAPITQSSLMQLTAEALKSAIPNAPSPRANSNTLENPEILCHQEEHLSFSSKKNIQI